MRSIWENNNANANANIIPTASSSKSSYPNVKTEEKVSVEANNREEVKPNLSKEKKPAEK